MITPFLLLMLALSLAANGAQWVAARQAKQTEVALNGSIEMQRAEIGHADEQIKSMGEQSAAVANQLLIAEQRLKEANVRIGAFQREIARLALKNPEAKTPKKPSKAKKNVTPESPI